jgi:hypothetical protein
MLAPGLPLLDEALELAELEQQTGSRGSRSCSPSGEPIAADGIFYNDLREPFMAADQAAVTLATTDKAMYTPPRIPCSAASTGRASARR